MRKVIKYALTVYVTLTAAFLLYLLWIWIFGYAPNQISREDVNKFYKYIGEKNLFAAKEMVAEGFDVNGYIAGQAEASTIICELLGGGISAADLKWLLDNFPIDPNRQEYESYFNGPLSFILSAFVEDTRPAIFWAMYKRTGSVELMKTLIEKGADVNIRSLRIGRFPLGEAYFEDNEEIFKLLLDNHANPCLKANNGWSAYEDIKKEPYYSYIRNTGIKCNQETSSGK